jgi:hypothetical protein
LIPTRSSLNQNYPNPFNPSTIINYEIPKDGLVTLKVYDLLGREIVSLVNEFKHAGNYNIEFRVQNTELTSGVYFYNLKVDNNFIQTKKMVLLR